MWRTCRLQGMLGNRGRYARRLHFMCGLHVEHRGALYVCVVQCVSSGWGGGCASAPVGVTEHNGFVSLGPECAEGRVQGSHCPQCGF